jgi:hypothetical protein
MIVTARTTIKPTITMASHTLLTVFLQGRSSSKGSIAFPRRVAPQAKWALPAAILCLQSLVMGKFTSAWEVTGKASYREPVFREVHLLLSGASSSRW